MAASSGAYYYAYIERDDAIGAEEMDKETILELWWKYIDDSCQYAIRQPPPLLAEPSCATCKHWHIFRDDTMEMISIYTPKEYEQICRGMKGEIIKAYNEKGEFVDTYNEYIFYGHCKRFPPTLPESDSITRKGFLSNINIKRSNLMAGYIFPVLPQKEVCGEWKRNSWVEERLSERK